MLGTAGIVSPSLATIAGVMLSTETEEYEALCRARLDHLVPVTQPLVLVSQVPRSGGTLLSQLFDGHPECHAHPHELRIGSPTSRHWPPIDLARPEEWFELLHEPYAWKHARRGYKKPAGVRPDRARDVDVFPFLFLAGLQQRIFDQRLAKQPATTRRDVIDAYFTSYFNAWVDNQTLYAEPKRVVTAFAPDLHVKPRSLEGFFADYPDGMLVSIVRDPRAWYASARNQKQQYSTVERALKKWRNSTKATLAAQAEWPERVVVITYEGLVRDTEGTMRLVAERVGITMRQELLVPTFNGRPIRANSSERVEGYGIRPERTEGWRERLHAETVAQVEELSGDLYERATAVGPPEA
jgi:Sulfotransferase family